MRFGNYNLTTETVEKRSNLIGLKKVKTTANQLVGRFHHTIGTFRRLKQTRSESPLSYKESLFERNIEPRIGRKEIFTKDDFPHRFTEENFYVFGKIGLNQSISGKNKSIYTSIESYGNEFNIKHLLDSKISDEDVEYKILKEYFDTTSYSDIVKDTDFKNYLNKKNYNDVLDYMQTDVSSQSNYDKIEFQRFDTTKRVYKTWGYGQSNKKSVKKINNFCNSLKRIKRMFTPDDEINKTVFIVPEKESCSHPPKTYHELRNSCEFFLNTYFVDKKLYKIKNSETNYSEQIYNKIIKHFVKSKGFSSTEDYVESKYTRVLNSVLKSCDEPVENDLAKNFIYEDVFKNYDYITPSCRKTCSTDIPSNRAFKTEKLDGDYDSNKEFYFNYNYNWDFNSSTNKAANVNLIVFF